MSEEQNHKIFHVLGGGTVNHVRSHFALSAIAYGGTAKEMHRIFSKRGLNSEIHLTKMAASGASKIETNDDVSKLVDEILANPDSGVVIFNVAITDFKGKIGDVPSGKYAERMKSREARELKVDLEMADKLVPRIKEQRPDIILVAFKTTTHVDEAEQINRGKGLLKGSNADLVLANDTGTRMNLILSSDGVVLERSSDRVKIIESLANHVYSLSSPTPQISADKKAPKLGLGNK
jgi:hypothetical protein